MSVNSNLHAKSKRVYLDKFVTLPHLPSTSGAGPGFNKKLEYISPDLDHTGIRTAFQEKVARPVKPNGRLTYDYKLNAFLQIATPARTLVKLERNKIRSHFEKNSTYEERLLSLDQKRRALGSTCERQLESEKDFLLPAESLEDSSMLSSKSQRSGQKRAMCTDKKRPKKIFNQRGIVDLLVETSDMSICSSSAASAAAALSLDGESTLGTVTSSSGGGGRAAERWDAEALRRVYGDDLSPPRPAQQQQWGGTHSMMSHEAAC
jgi:hypothetical protein